jgi:DNA gyrase subunit A
VVEREEETEEELLDENGDPIVTDEAPENDAEEATNSEDTEDNNE